MIFITVLIIDLLSNDTNIPGWLHLVILVLSAIDIKSTVAKLRHKAS